MTSIGISNLKQAVTFATGLVSGIVSLWILIDGFWIRFSASASYPINIHLQETPQVMTFPESEYIRQRQYDEAMLICLRSWEENPINLGALLRLRTLSRWRYDTWALGAMRDIRFARFVFLCVLSVLSAKLEETDVGGIDWWPLAEEVDIMIVRPYVKIYRWQSVASTVLQMLN